MEFFSNTIKLPLSKIPKPWVKFPTALSNYMVAHLNDKSSEKSTRVQGYNVN